MIAAPLVATPLPTDLASPRPAPADIAAVDLRGCRVSGATHVALAAYEDGLAALVSWRAGARAAAQRASAVSPGFVMAHLLEAYACMGGRDPRGVEEARAPLTHAAALSANDRERRHAAALAAMVVDDDYERAKDLLASLLARYPRDLLALHALHAVDYRTGDLAAAPDRALAVLDAWPRELPGYHAVLGIHAFSLQERGAYARAEAVAREALALNPRDARAIHAMAHVFEMTDRAAAGIRWLSDHALQWATDTVVACHCWWHLAVFHLADGDHAGALSLYDRRIRPGPQAGVSDLIDAAALLWRIELAGEPAGARWRALAACWEAHITDGYCSFNDIHAMLAFVGAADWTRARRLEQALEIRQASGTRHGESTRTIGLPACRALIAFGESRYTDAVALLGALPAHAHRLGGSHAQRDILNLTLLRAVTLMRRQARRLAA